MGRGDVVVSPNGRHRAHRHGLLADTQVGGADELEVGARLELAALHLGYSFLKAPDGQHGVEHPDRGLSGHPRGKLGAKVPVVDEPGDRGETRSDSSRTAAVCQCSWASSASPVWSIVHLSGAIRRARGCHLQVTATAKAAPPRSPFRRPPLPLEAANDAASGGRGGLPVFVPACWDEDWRGEAPLPLPNPRHQAMMWHDECCQHQQPDRPAHHRRGASCRAWASGPSCIDWRRNWASAAPHTTSPAGWRPRSRARPGPWTSSSAGCPKRRRPSLSSSASRPSTSSPRAARTSPSPPAASRRAGRYSCRRTWLSAPTAGARWPTPPTGAFATRSSTAPTAGRASPSSRACPTTDRARPWRSSTCAPTAAASTRTSATGATTPSRWPARTAGRA